MKLLESRFKEYNGYVEESYEPVCCQVIERFVKPGWTVMDIGAHIGYFTLLLSKCVATDGHVVAFEPLPENTVVLKENVLLNGCENVVVEQKAVTKSPGTADLFRTEWPLLLATASLVPNEERPTIKTYQVETTSVDEYLRAEKMEPQFMKIDVEGAEDSVLEGMSDTLRGPQPLVLLEVHENAGGLESKGLVMLTRNGYSLRGLLPTGELKAVDTTYRGHVLAVRE